MRTWPEAGTMNIDVFSCSTQPKRVPSSSRDIPRALGTCVVRWTPEGIAAEVLKVIKALMYDAESASLSPLLVGSETLLKNDERGHAQMVARETRNSDHRLVVCDLKRR